MTSELCSVLLAHLSVLKAVPYCLDYYNFVMYFEISVMLWVYSGSFSVSWCPEGLPFVTVEEPLLLSGLSFCLEMVNVISALLKLRFLVWLTYMAFAILKNALCALKKSMCPPAVGCNICLLGLFGLKCSSSLTLSDWLCVWMTCPFLKGLALLLLLYYSVLSLQIC